MFCPKCGLERQSAATSFCSRCGFLLTGTADLIELGGLLPTVAGRPAQTQSPRSRGVKQGLFIFLLTFLVVPLCGLLMIALNIREPFLPVLALLILGVGGILRMIYAWMFDAPAAAQAVAPAPDPAAELTTRQSPVALPGSQSVPTSVYVPPSAGRWRQTNDLEPRSVIEGTTKLLENEEDR